MTATLTRPALTVDAKPLAAAAQWVAKHLPRNPNRPELGGILLDAADGRLTLSGWDEETAVRATIPAECPEPLRVLVSGRLLAALTATLAAKPVTLTVAGTLVRIACGTVKATMPLMPVSDYPTLPARPATIGTVDAGVFATAVDRVAIAADHDGSTGIDAFGGVHLAFTAAGIRLSATDRHRGAIADIDWAGTTPATSVLIPADVLHEVARGLSDDGDITVSLDASRLDGGAVIGVVGFASATRSVVTRLLAEPFPPQFPNLFPPVVDTPVRVSAPELVEALRTALAVRAPKSPVALTFGPDSLALVAHGADGEAGTDATVDCVYAGPPLRIGANPEFLVAALNAAARSDVVELHATHPKRPILVVAVGDDRYRHLVVPVNLDIHARLAA